MLSWIFRHRARLAVIYGAVEPPALVGARFAGRPCPAAALAPGGREPARPGQLRRLARGQVELRPLPRRVG